MALLLNGNSDKKTHDVKGSAQDRRPPSQDDVEAITSDEKNDVEAGDSEAEDESKYPGPWTVSMLMVAICLAVFLVSLDRTILATAIPRISDEFHSFGDIGWYASAYALSGCAMQLPLGRFYSFYPPKAVYISLLFIFIVGSAIGAGAPNSTTIIVGRGVQGVGCAGVISGSIILLLENVPLRRRPIFIGCTMATMSISSVIGPLIGGALTSHASWRWCFIINIPLGMMAIVVVFFTVKYNPGKEHARSTIDKIKHLDPLGAAVLIPCVICLVLALQWGGSQYPWGDWRIILLLVLSGLLGVAFAAVQIMMPDTATVPRRVICQRSVAACLYYATCSGGTMMVVVYWIPIWFQAIKQASPVQSGEMTIPLLLSQSLASIIAGIMVSRVVGYSPPFMLASSAMMSVASGLLSTLTINSGSPYWIGYQVLFGFSLGFGMQQPSIAIQPIVKKQDYNSAISLFFFGMQLGGAICVCIGQNVLNQELIKSLTEAAIPGIDPNAVLHTGATELIKLVHTEADMKKLLLAYNHSVTSVFYIAAAVAGASIIGSALVEWKSLKGVERSFDEDAEEIDSGLDD